jgi:hypothetical protein
MGATRISDNRARIDAHAGNSTYQHTPQLPNPKNNATDMAGGRTRLNFPSVNQYQFFLGKSVAELKVSRSNGGHFHVISGRHESRGESV